MRAEYFASTTAGFATSTADSCTTGVSLSLTNFGGNLASGETCVVDNGSPGVSGAGCAAAGVVGQRFSMPPTAGDFIAILRAPGAGNDGTVTISTVVPSWLQFDWKAVGQENPRGIATFGLFKGEAKRIFQTEK
jgi:MSHA biogenesis protein MshQ